MADPDVLDAAVAVLDETLKDESLRPNQRDELVSRSAAALREAHDQVLRGWNIRQTAHVHEAPHTAVTTTSPLAHLMERAKKGDKQIVLQPRHAGSAFSTLTVGTETVEAVGVAQPEYAALPDGLSPAIAAALGIGKMIQRTIVPLKDALKHDHDVGVAVSADGFDPETVDASGLVCHDCGRELMADVYYQRILVCQRVHGHRPTELVPKHSDGAVECGLKDE